MLSGVASGAQARHLLAGRDQLCGAYCHRTAYGWLTQLLSGERYNEVVFGANAADRWFVGDAACDDGRCTVAAVL